MAAQKICNVCGIEYPASELFCPRDGSPLRTVGAGQSDLIGQIVADRYHVVHKLGDGGMGQVYLAEHVKMGRRIALKVLRPAIMMDPESVSRFNREAANASKISHPNVAAVYDFGETPAGLIFLAMEFVDGQSLTKVIAQAGALPARRAAEIVRQTAEGLAVAHDMGIVHRDLKPDNIMIARTRDGGDLVKVVDFGIAKSAGSDGQKVTKTGHVVGTPEYMSPEQLAGDRVDARSDIYSLALVAFNMLTGKLPFPSESAQESMIMRLIDRPKPLVQMRPDILWPTDVQRVIDKALERDVAQRYHTAPDFAKDLVTAIDRMLIGGAQTMSIETPTGVVQPAPLNGGAPAQTSGGELTPTHRPRIAALAGVAGLTAVLVGGFAMWYNRGASTSPLGSAPSSPVTSQGSPVAESAGRAGVKPPVTKRDDTQTRGGTKSTTPPAAHTNDKPPSNAVRGTDRSPSDGRTLVIPTPRLRVRDADLSATLRQRVDVAARGVDGVVVVDNATDAADIALRTTADGRLVVEHQGSRAAPLARFDSATAVKTLVPLFRREIALSILSVLETGAAGPKIDFQLSGGRTTFAVKDTIRIHVRPEQAGYLTLVDVDQTGVVTVLHPSGIVDIGRISAGTEVKFDHEFTVSPPTGNGVIRAIITDRPLALKREGDVLIEIDGPALALTICRALRTAGAKWSSASIAYVIQP